MTDAILPPRPSARPLRVTVRDGVPLGESEASALRRARALNLLGLVTPLANLGMLRVAPRDLRWFGAGAGVALLSASVVCWRAGWVGPAAWSLAAHAALVAAGLVHPRLPEVPARAWAAAVRAVGSVVAVPMFAVLYFLLVPPAILVARILFGTRKRRCAPTPDTWWVDRPPVTRERFERRI